MRCGLLLGIILLLTGCGSSGAATVTFAPVSATPAVTATATAHIASTATLPPPAPTVPSTTVLLDVGQLVDAGGFRLFIRCTGQGSPTVVMDAGLDGTHLAWVKVAPEAAKSTRTCVYDRAGLGESERGPTPRTSQMNAETLHTLLSNANVAGPYLLVAHSLGGWNIRMFAGLYPQEVAGMVFVDATLPEDQTYYEQSLTPAQQQAVDKVQKQGVEGRTFDFKASAAQVLAARLPDVPAVVLTSDPAKLQEELQAVYGPGFPAGKVVQFWQERETALARRFAQGKLVVATGSGHQIPGEQPGLVIDAISQILKAIHP